MNLTFINWRIGKGILLLLIGLIPQLLVGGLVLNISEEISSDQISSIKPINGNLIVKVRGEKYCLYLPSQSLENIVVWVSENAKGPFIFSVDAAFISGANTYISPDLPFSLGSIMIDYDVYAHSLARGSVPKQVQNHPLIAKYGEEFMPDAQYVSLLDPRNSSNRALWYRRLTSKFYSKPAVIGELTIKALPSKNGLPVRLSIFSNRWLDSPEWYRDIDVASAWDHKAFGLPYEALKNDMETRWDDYRKAFKPMDEVSSIVEAYSILLACMRQKPNLWNQFLDQLADSNAYISTRGYLNASNAPALSGRWGSFPTRSWKEWSMLSLDEGIQTIAQADLALSLMCQNSGWYCNDCDRNIPERKADQWLPAIESLAEHSSRLKAKLFLFKSLNTKSDKDKVEFGQIFFDLTHKSMDFFRLRVSGWNLLECQVKKFQEADEDWENFLITERKSILNDFINEVENQCHNNGDSSMLTWENLLQNIYSTRLLELAEDEYGYYFDDNFIYAVACVHTNRGIVFQRGLEIGYRHANYRFLLHMTKRIYDNPDLELYIRSSAEKILNSINAANNLQEVRHVRNKVKSLKPSTNNGIGISTIEGKLESSRDWVLQKIDKSNPAINFDALPGGILWTGGVLWKKHYSILIMDPALFQQLVELANGESVMITGILHDKKRSITPLKIKYLNSGQWCYFEFPHSGIAGPGVLGGDE